MALKQKVVGLAIATHFGPLLLVVTISFCLAISQLSFPKSFQIALAIFAGQCVVGWTNDLIDHPRDHAAGRIKKPLVHEAVTRRELQIGVAIAMTAAILLSFFGPLGIKGGLLHMLGIGSATAYNFGVKATWFSPLPYAISFGALPWAIYLASGKHPSTWLFVDFISISLAFHFLNVIKDLEWDRNQLVMGLPQRVGKKWSVAAAAICIVTGVLFLLA